MTTANLIRVSGLSAIASGALVALSVFIVNSAWITALMAVTTIFGLIGIYAVQVKESGVAGFVGYVLSTIGWVVLAGGSATFAGIPAYILGSSLGALGLVLLAVGILSGRAFPRWVAGLWIAAVVIGLPSVFIPSMGTNLGMILGILGALASGLGLAGAGYTLWSRPA
jgi:hypothetical protein